MSRLIFIYALFIVSSFEIHAQLPGPASAERDAGWLTTGIGASSIYDYSVSLTANFGRTEIFQFAYRNSDHLNIFGNQIFFSSGISVVSLSYGLSSVSDIGRIAGFIGSGYMWDNDISKNNSYFIKHLGLVSNIQFIISPFKELGIGLDIYWNLYGIKSIAGLCLSIIIEGNK
jgi:hypothetical protein